MGKSYKYRTEQQMIYLTAIILLFLFSSCSALPPDRSDIKNVFIAIPSNIDPSVYWPNSEDVYQFYGEPSSIKRTKYGKVYCYKNIPGCDSLLIYFETDTERGWQNLVSSMTYVSVSIENNSIKLGPTKKSAYVLLKPLVFEGGIVCKDRFRGVGACSELIKQTDGKYSIEVPWE
jgi:hypothetical protein